jgi:DinB superfamily
MSGAPALHPQLEAIRDEFIAAQIRLHRLADTIPQTNWSRRPKPERWSIAECVGHLNLTGAAFLPLLEAALRQGRESGITPPKRYRRDPVGWLLWRTAGPPVRYRTRTAPAFVPASDQPVPELLKEFDRLQAAQIGCVVQADGLDLGRLWIRSPFNPRVRYNAYSCLTILPRHQHRHLWQAESVAKEISS